jgi:CO dehydrogenase maturation factor
MTTTVAFAGKGGTGKTTITALMIRAITERTSKPVLAIDADPAANLHLALGMRMPVTVGEIREQLSEAAQPSAMGMGMGISRHEHLTHEVRMAVEEGQRVDLLAMGRPEGQGCYCAVNHLLREIIDEFSRGYPFVVMDNEAGMEHISRRTTRDVDLLFLVTDPSVRGVRAAASMAELAGQIEVNVRDIRLIVNRVQGSLPAPLQGAIEDLGLPIAGKVPADPMINQLDALGKPLVGLDGDSPAWRAVRGIAVESLSLPEAVP